MNYLEFFNTYKYPGCFNINEIFAWRPNFNRNNLLNWENKNLIFKIKNGWYAFSEKINDGDFAEYIANRIYNPSYLSLQYMLAYYGMIPEAVVDYTSITTLKTNKFKGLNTNYFYYSVKESLFMGYDLKKIDNNLYVKMATPEKSLFDFIYLNNQYKTEEDFLNLRLDEDFMENNFNIDKFMEFGEISKKKAIINRMTLLLKTYNL